MYKEFSKPLLKLNDGNVSRPDCKIQGKYSGKIWGAIGQIEEKKSDGWGGHTYVKKPGDITKYAEQLKLIAKGDLNVG
jgi:hypothetical protein